MSRLDSMTFEEGLARLAPIAKSAMEKRALSTEQIREFANSLAQNPAVTRALTGAGIGGGLGLVSSALSDNPRRNYGSRFLTGATLGGLGGLAYHGLDQAQSTGATQPLRDRLADQIAKVEQAATAYGAILKREGKAKADAALVAKGASPEFVSQVSSMVAQDPDRFGLSGLPAEVQLQVGLGDGRDHVKDMVGDAADKVFTAENAALAGGTAAGGALGYSDAIPVQRTARQFVASRWPGREGAYMKFERPKGFNPMDWGRSVRDYVGVGNLHDLTDIDAFEGQGHQDTAKTLRGLREHGLPAGAILDGDGLLQNRENSAHLLDKFRRRHAEVGEKIKATEGTRSSAAADIRKFDALQSGVDKESTPGWDRSKLQGYTAQDVKKLKNLRDLQDRLETRIRDLQTKGYVDPKNNTHWLPTDLDGKLKPVSSSMAIRQLSNTRYAPPRAARMGGGLVGAGLGYLGTDALIRGGRGLSRGIMSLFGQGGGGNPAPPVESLQYRALSGTIPKLHDLDPIITAPKT